MEDQQLGQLAQFDQASAGNKNMAKLFADYFRSLVDEGMTRDEALCMVVEYQRIVLVDRQSS